MNKEETQELVKQYPYLYETHLHTKVSSACAKSTPEDMVKACKEYGYTGIIVTDHNWYGNTAINRNFPWKFWVEAYAESYERAHKEGERQGLQVFFGYESCFKGTEFLIYGVDKEWLMEHPEIKTASIEEQYQIIHKEGGMVIHAHPFREEDYIPEIRLFPQYVDGVEGVNATHSNPISQAHNQPEFDERAIKYARENQLAITAGSDVHNTVILGGGVAFRRKLESIQDYIKMIKEDGDYLLTDGEHWYKKDGERLCD